MNWMSFRVVIKESQVEKLDQQVTKKKISKLLVMEWKWEAKWFILKTKFISVMGEKDWGKKVNTLGKGKSSYKWYLQQN